MAWLTTLSVYDIRERRLPNWLTLPGALVVLLGALVVGRGASAAAGALVLFAVYFAVHLGAPLAMGAGDVKLSLGIGALTGAFGMDVWVLAALAAPLLTAAWALMTLVRRAETTVPHGPSMCIAALAAVALRVV